VVEGSVSAGEVARRLRYAGYSFEPSRTGKHFWVEPQTGRRLPEDRDLYAEWREIPAAEVLECQSEAADTIIAAPELERLTPPARVAS
jgi:hypothetical protein